MSISFVGRIGNGRDSSSVSDSVRITRGLSLVTASEYMSGFWREILTCKYGTNVILYYIYNLYNISKERFSRLMEVIESYRNSRKELSL